MSRLFAAAECLRRVIGGAALTSAVPSLIAAALVLVVLQGCSTTPARLPAVPADVT